jgi:hypothetical protein
MSLRGLDVIVCDACGERLFAPAAHCDARARAQMQGWTTTESGSDFCPQHSGHLTGSV